MFVYHFLTQTAFAEAHRRATLGRLGDGPLLFAPTEDWAPTFFRTYGHHAGLRAASMQEMLAGGLYRFAIAAQELKLVSQLAGTDQRAVDPLLDALAQIGIEPTGWRALIEPRSTFDVVNDRLVLGRWRRITDARWGANGLEVLQDVPVLPVAAAHRRRRT